MTGEVCEFEALARWNDPRYGFLSPAVFVGVLEE
jgi:sensor c-di-GMP phosphodiesterase-like protein